VYDEPLTCAECGREPRENENAADEWRAHLDVEDELPVFCPGCVERGFGDQSCGYSKPSARSLIRLKRLSGYVYTSEPTP
jgi:hypothetical protein